MNPVFRSAFVLLLAVSFFCSHSHADDAEEMAGLMSDFYDGLADVIERNMDDPDRCLSEVDSYYDENRDTVERVQRLMAKAMEQASSMMEQFEAAGSADSDEDYMDAEELAKMAQERGMVRSEPPDMDETDRYTKALEEFMQKHPAQALRIATKAVVFVSPSKALE